MEKDRKKALIDKALSIINIDATTNKGDVRTNHLMAILDHLIEVQTEDYSTTQAKLALTISMEKRRIRENYLEGMEAYGIIKMRTVDRRVIWEWNVFLTEDEEKEAHKPTEELKPYLLAKSRIGRVKDISVCNKCSVKDKMHIEDCEKANCNNANTFNPNREMVKV